MPTTKGWAVSSPLIKTHQEDIITRRPSHRYLLDPTKILLVISEWGLPRTQDLLQVMGIALVTGSMHLVEFISEAESQHDFMEEQKTGLDRGG